ncbi:GntR family transcriptional regulator [Microbacterium sp. BWT-B31]|uniref:GntR family transcriptional regulator n=1 Tax=Microbacterium sp. BWT-B31 TaxID=3232072 RepID=UPI003528DAD6
METNVDPLRYQLAIEYVRGLIRDGLPRGTRLPTERDLAGRLAISRVSVRRALDELEESGEIRRVQGSGTFVDGPAIEKGRGIESFTAEMTAMGSVAGAIVHSVEVKSASADVSWQLGISPSEPVIEIRRVRTADGIPMSFEIDSLPHSRVPGLESCDLSGSLYRLLSSRYSVELARVQQTFRATTLDPSDAELLSVAPYSAALSVHHVAYETTGSPIYVSESLYRGDRYSLTIDVPSVEA